MRPLSVPVALCEPNAMCTIYTRMKCTARQRMYMVFHTVECQPGGEATDPPACLSA